MAHVKIKALNDQTPYFGAQPDAAAVTANAFGLVWFAPDAPGSVDGVVLQTFGGTIDPVTKQPTGFVTSYSIYLKDGTELVSVDGLRLAVGKLLAGSSDALEDRVFAGPDLVEGAALADELAGLSGDDTLLGRGGDDTLVGGEGSDELKGGAGSDLVSYADLDVGGTVNLTAGVANFGLDVDTLASVERVVGSSLDDLLIGSLKDNAISGGLGDDQIHAGRGADRLAGQGGDDLVRGGGDDDALSGGGGNDYLGGDEGDDLLSGSVGHDSLYGGDGDDSLVGGAGSDVLVGGAGNDTLDGGKGKNGFDGGAGNDVFHFAKASDYVTTGAGFDTLVFDGATKARVQVGDFNVGKDMIALDVADPDASSVDDLMESGMLKVTGGDGFTVIAFGTDKVVLTGTDFDDFSTNNFALI